MCFHLSIRTVGALGLVWGAIFATARADILVSDHGGSQVIRYDQITGAHRGVLVSEGSGGLDEAIGLRLANDGSTLLVSSQNYDPAGGALLKYDLYSGAFLGVFASNATPGAGLAQPADFVFGPDGNLYVANFSFSALPTGSTINRFSPTGVALGSYTYGAPTFLGSASTIFGSDGKLYVSIFGQHKILRFEGPNGSNPGQFLDTFAIQATVLENTLNGPAGMLFDAGGNMYVASLYSHEVIKYSSTGVYLDKFNTDPGDNSPDTFPSSLMFHADGSLLVAETGGEGVFRFNIGADPTQPFGHLYGQFTQLKYPGNPEADPTPLQVPGNMLIVPNINQWMPNSSGLWNNAPSWSDGVVPEGNAAVALLWNKLETNGTVDLGSSPRTVKQLRFRNTAASYTLIAGTGGKLILDAAAGTGNARVQFDSDNTQDHTIAANVRYNVDTDVILIDHKLTLSGEQDWNGKTVTLKSGTLQFNNATATNVTTGSKLVIDSGATVELAGTSSGTSAAGSRVNVTNNGTLSVLGTQQTVGLITGSGNLTLEMNAGLNATGAQQAGALALHGDNTHTTGRLTIATSGSGPSGSNAAVTRVNSLTIDPNGPTFAATLDLNNNDLIVNNTAHSTTLLSDITAMLRSGLNGATTLPWNGTGITSTYAASGPLAGKTALGVIRNVVNPAAAFGAGNGAKYSSFAGLAVSGDEILVKYTWYGDFDLDGHITSLDYALLDAGLANAVQLGGQPGWFFGDANYDGVVNLSDYNLLQSGYTGYSNGGFISLPEPSARLLGVVGLVGLLLAARRRQTASFCS